MAQPTGPEEAAWETPISPGPLASAARSSCIDAVNHSLTVRAVLAEITAAATCMSSRRWVGMAQDNHFSTEVDHSVEWHSFCTGT